MKNKNVLHILFPVLALGMMAAPLVGMAVAPTTTTTENRTLASLPSLMDENGLRRTFLSELGDYFSDHYAGKNTLVAIDSQLQSRLFHTSAVDTVLLGEDGWLYYTDSLDDYLGRNVVTDRGAFNIVHNLALMQENAEKNGARFLFTVAPNKNSLYPEHMPESYALRISESSNLNKVVPLLEQQKVPYADLMSAFRAQESVLYCAQDSHWTGQGAVLAYETITKTLDREPVDYNTVADVVHTKLEPGDLGTAVYSIWAEPEWNYRYDYPSAVSFAGEGKDWEANWIETTSDTGRGSLLMFRDSFGISLAPFLAEDYAEGGFSRNTVYMWDSFLEQNHPDTVIVEIVERNLDRFGVFTPEEQRSKGPAVMAGPIRDANAAEAERSEEACAGTTMAMESSALMPTYAMITGEIAPEFLQDDTRVYVQVTDGGETTLYEAYTVSRAGTEAGTWMDNGYLLYLDAEELSSEPLDVKILTGEDGRYTIVGEGTLVMEGSADEE